ncbi:TraR/DksA family transcriptional regulator [Nocardioides abyssi]|uniref:DksA C4-type domain-containing protein n=1 Tax=Nocardioides abyssi TaxID=3058370 RepID=A0ABT8EVG3_9ACTN|nr:hypothetical protein [Nocardioides abyssi]MDN4162054.1 hypothetical protein [Nocardioides abyssi]
MTLKPVGAQRAYLDELRSELLRAAYRRTHQLGALPPPGVDEDVVQAAHRASVQRILGQVHAALDRLDAGTYGECVACGRLVALQDLRRCPWTERCGTCIRSTV